jgi:hypothetical protein
MALRDLRDGVDVDEVDHLRHVSRRETDGIGVAVDRDDAEPTLARLHDRAPLVAPGTDEEDRLHGRGW